MDWFFFLVGGYGTHELNDNTAWTGSAAGMQVMADTAFTKVEATRDGEQVDVLTELVSDGATGSQGSILRLPKDEPITAITLGSGKVNIIFDDNPQS